MVVGLGVGPGSPGIGVNLADWFSLVLPGSPSWFARLGVFWWGIRLILLIGSPWVFLLVYSGWWLFLGHWVHLADWFSLVFPLGSLVLVVVSWELQ